MIDFETILTLAQKELRDARRNRWFVLYAIAFATLSLALAWLALSGAGNFGLAGFGRTAASMINLVLLIVPLMGLTLGALSLTGERERGTWLYLLAQPIDQTELLLGKFLGLALALIAALGLGFGLTGVLIAFNGRGGAPDVYITLLLLTCLVALASLSIGFLVATIARRSAAALGMALFVWLALVLLGDLGLMGTALILKLDVGQLFGLALINPLQLFRLAAILGLRQDLDVLGPVGIYALRQYGANLRWLLTGLLILWIIAPLLATAWAGRRRGAL